MSAPPPRADFSSGYIDLDPNPSNAALHTALVAFWDYVTGLLGSSGTPADARTALGAAASLGALPSMIWLNTANGYGSVNTSVPRFLNTVVNQGTDITYVDSATLGNSFTINVAGVYAMAYCSSSTVNADIYITKDSIINTLTATLARATTSAANFAACAASTAHLPAGTVIRAVGDATAEGSRPRIFTIQRVA